MQRLSARVVVVVVCLSLLAFGMPARSKAVDEVFTFSATDPTSGASGQFFFQYDASGQLVFINGYASTSDWSAGIWWSPSGGWQFGEVMFSDPELGSLGSIRGSSRALLFEDDPPNYPTDPPTPLPGQKSCQECIDDLRNDCHTVAVAVAAGSVATAGTFVATCMPPAIPSAPPTIGGSIAFCAIGAIGILGTGIWAAKAVEKQCRKQAPISCSDPNTGKPCYQLGYY